MWGGGGVGGIFLPKLVSGIHKSLLLCELSNNGMLFFQCIHKSVLMILGHCHINGIQFQEKQSDSCTLVI